MPHPAPGLHYPGVIGARQGVTIGGVSDTAQNAIARLGALWRASSLRLPAGMVFARASQGVQYQGLSYAGSEYSLLANHVPRFGIISALGDFGLLIEGARTNQLLQSGDLSNASWTKAGTGAAALQSNGWSRLSGITTSSNVVYQICSSLGASATYFPAFRLRKVSPTTGTFRIIAPVQTGSYTVDVAAIADGDLIHYLHPAVSAITPFVSQAGGGGGIEWVQNAAGPWSLDVLFPTVEAAAFPSYSGIPTTTAAAARAAETASRPFTMPSGGFLDYLKIKTALGLSGNQVFKQWDDNTANNRITLRRDSSGHLQLDVVVAGSVTSLDAGAMSSFATHKVAARIQGGNFGLSLDGGTAVTSSAAAPTGLTTERWGCDSAGGGQPFAYFIEGYDLALATPGPIGDVGLAALST